jgi:hypothetical protein
MHFNPISVASQVDCPERTLLIVAGTDAATLDTEVRTMELRTYYVL